MARFRWNRELEARLVAWLEQAARTVAEATAQWGREVCNQSEEKPLKARHDSHLHYSEVWWMHPGVSEKTI